MACYMCEKYRWEDQQEVIYTDSADGKGYCLFHAPAEHKGVSFDEFNEHVSERIQETIDLEDEIAECNLSGTIFPEEICFAPDSTLPTISFCHASFERGAHFSESTFVGCADFSDATFGGAASFSEAKFKGLVFFSNATFVGSVDFSETQFDKDAGFGRATFREDVFFSEAKFKGRTVFDNASFEEKIDFKRVGFENQASFTGSTLEKGADFTSASFAAGSNTFALQVNGLLLFHSIQADKEAVLKFVDCIISRASIIFQNCDLTCCDFSLQRDLTNIHFVNSSWEMKCRIRPDGEDQKSNLQLTRDFYQRMKAKYKDENNEYEASKWHVAEKEAQLKLFRWNGESRFLWIMLWLYKFVSGFGENAARAFWVLIGFAVLPLLALTGIEVSHHFARLDFDITMIHHIIKDWLKFVPLARTIGENEPGGLHVLMIFWQLLITLQATLFAFALRNRFRR